MMLIKTLAAVVGLFAFFYQPALLGVILIPSVIGVFVLSLYKNIKGAHDNLFTDFEIKVDNSYLEDGHCGSNPHMFNNRPEFNSRFRKGFYHDSFNDMSSCDDFSTSSISSSFCDINPGSGLPMMDCCNDIAGNMYGEG